jgi:hypothetical protein
VHRALWEYLQEINTEDEVSADRKRREIFERFAGTALFDGDDMLTLVLLD